MCMYMYTPQVNTHTASINTCSFLANSMSASSCCLVWFCSSHWSALAICSLWSPAYRDGQDRTNKSHVHSVRPSLKWKAYCIFWLEPVSTSKPLAPPQSHIKEKLAVNQGIRGHAVSPVCWGEHWYCSHWYRNISRVWKGDLAPLVSRIAIGIPRIIG